jgi:hypothetical protein
MLPTMMTLFTDAMMSPEENVCEKNVNQCTSVNEACTAGK